MQNTPGLIFLVTAGEDSSFLELRFTEHGAWRILLMALSFPGHSGYSGRLWGLLWLCEQTGLFFVLFLSFSDRFISLQFKEVSDLIDFLLNFKGPYDGTQASQAVFRRRFDSLYISLPASFSFPHKSFIPCLGKQWRGTLRERE